MYIGSITTWLCHIITDTQLSWLKYSSVLMTDKLGGCTLWLSRLRADDDDNDDDERWKQMDWTWFKRHKAD